jgi:hypothetical protein
VSNHERDRLRHNCPRKGCRVNVSNVLFCCADHWWELSNDARSRIRATANMGLLSLPRRNAITTAFNEWKALDEQAEHDASKEL